MASATGVSRKEKKKKKEPAAVDRRARLVYALTGLLYWSASSASNANATIAVAIRKYFTRGSDGFSRVSHP